MLHLSWRASGSFMMSIMTRFLTTGSAIKSLSSCAHVTTPSPYFNKMLVSAGERALHKAQDASPYHPLIGMKKTTGPCHNLNAQASRRWLDAHA